MANPPFIERGRGTEAPNPAKSAANMEGEAALGDWVRFALVMVRAKGTVTAFGENWYSKGAVRGWVPGAGVRRRSTRASESSLRMAPDSARSTRARANGPAG